MDFYITTQNYRGYFFWAKCKGNDILRMNHGSKMIPTFIILAISIRMKNTHMNYYLSWLFQQKYSRTFSFNIVLHSHTIFLRINFSIL